MRHLAQAAILLAAATAAGGTKPKLTDWAHRAPITLAATPDKGIVEFTLTPEVYATANPTLADLRVVADDATELAYTLTVRKGTTTTVPLQVRLYNRTYIAGKQSSVTADFGAKVLKHRIQVNTPGTNFRRKVRVEGSDDGTTWQTIRADALLFRIAGPKHGDYHRNTVDLPPNDQRYLRVTVSPGQDDPDRLDPVDVKAWRVARTPPGTQPVPIVDTTVRQNVKEQTTEVELDLALNNLPLHRLTLTVADANFFRRITVSGRRRSARPADTGDVFRRNKRREEPWRHIMSGAIYRYTSGGSKAKSLSIDLKGATFRYLRVRIANADDPPLRVERAEATLLVHTVAFQPKAGQAYALYFGNGRAVRPSYDLPHYIARLRREGVTAATLGPSAKPDAAPQAPPPTTFSHRLALWVVLLAVLAILTLMVYRQGKHAQPPPE